MRHPTLQYFEGTDGQTYWRLVVPHFGQTDIVAVGGQGYENYADAKQIAEKVIRGAYNGAIALSERLPRQAAPVPTVPKPVPTVTINGLPVEVEGLPLEGEGLSG